MLGSSTCVAITLHSTVVETLVNVNPVLVDGLTHIVEGKLSSCVFFNGPRGMTGNRLVRYIAQLWPIHVKPQLDRRSALRTL